MKQSCPTSACVSASVDELFTKRNVPGVTLIFRSPAAPAELSFVSSATPRVYRPTPVLADAA